MRLEYEKRRAGLRDTLRASYWREEFVALWHQRNSVMFVMAAMIVMAAFWTNTWAWAVFFFVLALYSALSGVRMGIICGLSFCLWFVAGLEGWIRPLTWQNQAAGLWCIAALFLLVIAKADALEQLRDVRKKHDVDP